MRNDSRVPPPLTCEGFPPTAHTVAPVPSPSTRATSQRRAALGAADRSHDHWTRTAPPRVNAVSGLVYHSTAVPPAVSVIWIGAVQPATVLVTSLWKPAPRLVHASRVTGFSSGGVVAVIAPKSSNASVPLTFEWNPTWPAPVSPEISVPVATCVHAPDPDAIRYTVIAVPTHSNPRRSPTATVKAVADMAVEANAPLTHVWTAMFGGETTNEMPSHVDAPPAPPIRAMIPPLPVVLTVAQTNTLGPNVAGVQYEPFGPVVTFDAPFDKRRQPVVPFSRPQLPPSESGFSSEPVKSDRTGTVTVGPAVLVG